MASRQEKPRDSKNRPGAEHGSKRGRTSRGPDPTVATQRRYQHAILHVSSADESPFQPTTFGEKSRRVGQFPENLERLARCTLPGELPCPKQPPLHQIMAA